MLSQSASVEALLFASGEPLEKKRLATLLSLSEEEVTLALKALRQQLDGHGVSIIETEREVELRTSPEASTLVQKLRESELARDLGKASLETLSVIAYRPSADGGATRSEIDWVRGVHSSASVRTLLLRGLIEGREDARDKRRIRYILTPEALAHLGLSRSEDLPRYGELSVAARDVVRTESASEIEPPV